MARNSVPYGIPATTTRPHPHPPGEIDVRSVPLFALALAAGLAAPSLADDAGGRWSSQAPEVVPSHARGEAAAPAKPDAALAKGPAPSWIWGADADRRYVLRKEFPGGSKSARLKAAADNHVTVYLNGRRVAEGDDWNEPVEVDVQDRLKSGTNELLVEVANEAGSPAGFALKLAQTLPDGGTRYVVSDDSWRVAEKRGAKDWAPVKVLGTMGAAPWGDVFDKAAAVAGGPRNVFETQPGFQVERLFTVPRETLGSWVAIAFDNKGRLIASDQGKLGLCRITPAPIGSNEPTKVEHLGVKITSAQGLLYAFDSLYVSVNGGPEGSGLYRVRDTDGDDQYDKVEKLATFGSGGEHGTHALRLTPDGKNILIVCGNHTAPPERLAPGPAPGPWVEDLLLPRQWDAGGHAVGILAPGGYIAQTDPDGKAFRMVSVGYRNAYDMAFNADGELFSYDSDMEWDYGMPWYRPTRAVHATSGSDFGWRSGTGNPPAYYVDSLPPVENIGPGSPVGVTFGYGAKFPAKYQKALLLLDWTFGTIYALHLKPDGSSYKADREEFLSRTPLPLTDAAVGPDGALYVTIGGRGTQSELFRVTYVGKESTAPADARDPAGADARALRHKLEQYHRRADDQAAAVAVAYPHLGHADRFIRFAARVALEHQDPKTWQDRVLAERDPEALINGAVGLAHQADKALEPKLVEALGRLDYSALDARRRLDLLRAYAVVFARMGAPEPAAASRLAKTLDGHFPAGNDFENRELANVLVYLKAPGVVGKLIALMKQGRGPESAESLGQELLSRNAGYGGTIAQMQANRPDAQKIHYAFILRNLKEGWTPEERKFYFRWLTDARKWSGGASYQGFITNIDKDAFENSTEAERLAVEAAGARTPFRVKELPKPKGPGHAWTLDELLAKSKDRMAGRDFANGKRTFAAARCVLCHRFAGDGGATGPDLTQAAGRFAARDLAEAIVEPSKVISDQFRAAIVATHSGKVYTGRVVGESKAAITMVVDPEDPTKVVEIAREDIDESKPSPVSLMPDKLLEPLGEDEVLDLFAYILSRGDQGDAMFRKK